MQTNKLPNKEFIERVLLGLASCALVVFFSSVTCSKNDTEEIVETTETTTTLMTTDAPETTVHIYIPPEEDVHAIAKTLYGECRGIPSMEEKAAVAWCILNRVDSDVYDFGDSVLEVVTAPHQFLGYHPDNPLEEELVALAEDVLIRHHLEKEGADDVGRVLPSEYIFFIGDGEHNWFSIEYQSTEYYDFSGVKSLLQSGIKEGIIVYSTNYNNVRVRNLN